MTTLSKSALNAMTLVYSNRKNLSRFKISEHAITAPCPFCFTTILERQKKIKNYSQTWTCVTVNHPFVIQQLYSLIMLLLIIVCCSLVFNDFCFLSCMHEKNLNEV